MSEASYSDDLGLLTAYEASRKRENNAAEAFFFEKLDVGSFYTHTDQRKRRVFIHPDCIAEYLDPHRRPIARKVFVPTFGHIFAVYPRTK